MTNRPSATPANGPQATPQAAPRAAQVSSTRALVRGALGLSVGILAGAVVFGEGGIIQQIQNQKVENELQARGFQPDPITGNRLSPENYAKAMAVRNESLTREQICGRRVELRSGQSMEDAETLDECLQERAGECMTVNSSFRTNGDQYRLKHDPRYKVVNKPGTSNHEVGTDWDVPEETAKALYKTGCICDPNMAPTTKNGRKVMRCGGGAGIPNDPWHIYRGGPQHIWLKGKLEKAKWKIEQRFKGTRGK